MHQTQARPDAPASRKLSRPVRLVLASLGVAAAVGGLATLRALLAEGSLMRAPGPAALAAVALVAVATQVNLLLRFVRWQFLLRRLDVRVPTVPSLGAFAGSFAFLPIPFCLGQIVARTRLVHGVEPSRRPHLLLAALLERMLDAWVIAVLSLPALGPSWRWVAAAVLAAPLLPPLRAFGLDLAVRVTAWASSLVFNEPLAVDVRVLARAGRGRALAVSWALSLAAWVVVVAAALPLARAAGLALPPLDVAGAVAGSIAIGGASPVPLGAGTSGLFLLDELRRLGGAPESAALTVFVFRAATVWLTVGLGATALLLHHRRSRQPTAHDHFDEIDECYDAWLPEHFRRHLVEKKIGAMGSHLGRAGPGMRGLDIGCGRGWYMRELRRAGFAMVGVDLSRRQLVAAREYLSEPAPLVRGSALHLPFASASFDFAYIINVLHHLPTPAHQAQALRDIGSVVRPGGLVFVHEMNVINPLFRFYLGYVFPILKGIEEGNEHYLNARRLVPVAGLELEAVDYFTFVPDFVPGPLLPWLAPLERWLEQSALGRYAAHFVAVYRRSATARSATGHAGWVRPESERSASRKNGQTIASTSR